MSAGTLAPELADPHYYQAVVLAAGGRAAEAACEFEVARQLDSWVDTALPGMVDRQLEELRYKRKGEK